MPYTKTVEVAEQLLGVYRSLLGERRIEEFKRKGTRVGKLLTFLSQIIEGRFDPDALSDAETCLLLGGLLEGCAIRAATIGHLGVFEPLHVGNPVYLGPRKRLRATFSESDSILDDWSFQVLIQAWLTAKGLGPVKDLRDDSRFKGKKVCDFVIEADGNIAELVECKRVHPKKRIKKDFVKQAVEKVCSKMPATVEQLRETAKGLSSNLACKHALFDISDYSFEQRELPIHTGHLSTVGFAADEVEGVKRFIAEDLSRNSVDLDKVTICWRNFVIIDGKIRAIVHSASSLTLNPSANSVLDYEGWTVESHPMRSVANREIRVSATAEQSIGSLAPTFCAQISSNLVLGQSFHCRNLKWAGRPRKPNCPEDGQD